MRIAVIGGGVIGLTTGVLLSQQGYEVNLYTRELPNKRALSFTKIASSAACAIWLPIWTFDPNTASKEFQEKLIDWCRFSFREFVTRIGDVYGISWTRNHELFPNIELAPSYLKGLLPNFEESMDYSLHSIADLKGVNIPQVYRWSFDTLIIETPVYLPKLINDFRDLGGKIQMQEFSEISQITSLPEDVVFNCVGLEAKTLFNDLSLNGVKGQLLLHERVDLPFSVGAGNYCLIPRKDALILGSLFEDTFDTLEPTAENNDLLFHTIQGLCGPNDSAISLPEGTLSKAKLLGSVSALRPYRKQGVRVEREEIDGKIIIHNYGHGGAGITMSWGTARYALDLLDQ
jgi:D-amino-acid oxidase